MARIFQIILCFLLFNSCQTSREDLFDELNGHEWKKLTPEEIEFLSQHYDIDLKKVRYVEKARILIPFDGLTIDYKIFFKKKKTMKLLAHELEHVQQFQDNPQFVAEYLHDSLQIASTTSTNSDLKSIHNDVEFEKIAKNKAKRVNRFWKKFQKQKTPPLIYPSEK